MKFKRYFFQCPSVLKYSSCKNKTSLNVWCALLWSAPTQWTSEHMSSWVLSMKHYGSLHPWFSTSSSLSFIKMFPIRGGRIGWSSSSSGWATMQFCKCLHVSQIWSSRLFTPTALVVLSEVSCFRAKIETQLWRKSRYWNLRHRCIKTHLSYIWRGDGQSWTRSVLWKVKAHILWIRDMELQMAAHPEHGALWAVWELA